ncbi:PP2C family serine/threonine-protein phosphatase [Streptomyces thermolilacinus]|uniref:PPM-type phosphatase domain-containing protein n=1 Tax=Streptomyces thermolilacinus SPC6 TaxID=1306406 RepID=A0A1D3DV92_9ACTN|nr:PP2C family serine/threonine-protein phosphatase [Streptomyces thermolilacinus]OEJ96244.1 hypothetical protein J116_019045 [Streptomyces thermolilacinus SPC6]
MSKTRQLSACPGCSEPPEPGDRFCGACGYDLSAVPEPSVDHPTVALTTPLPPPPAFAPPPNPAAPPAAAPPAAAPPAAAPPAAAPPAAAPPAPLAPAAPPAPTAPPVAPAPPAVPAYPAAAPVPPPAPSYGGHGAVPQAPGVPPAPAAPPPTLVDTPMDPAAHMPPAAPAVQAGPPAPPLAPTPPPVAASASGTPPEQPATPPEQHSSATRPVPEPPVRYDDRTGDFELAAPDPRLAPQATGPTHATAPTTPGETDAIAETGVTGCVACRAGRVSADGYCENCGHKQPQERDHMEREVGRAVAAVSDRGLRHHRNEDAFAVSDATLPDGSPAVVAIVCDGVSSASRPDDASAAAARAADASLRAGLPLGTNPQQAMHDAIVAASDAVNALADEPPGDGGAGSEHDAHRHRNAPACTVVGAVTANGLLVVGWVGDSRAYWVPDDRSAPAARLTEDDSWAAQMVAAGLMNEAEAYADERAHAITGWLGADAYELEPHTAVFRPDRPGVVVVCTDGLWNYAESADDMARVLPADAAEHPLHCARVLVGHALDGGGHDNVTVAVVPFAVPGPGREPGPVPGAAPA